MAVGPGGFSHQQSQRARGGVVQATAESGEETLRRVYARARRELIAGKYDSARTTFARLTGEAQNRQPLLNWIRLHRGLANLLRGYTTQARQAFEELEKAGPFSTKPEDKALADFFVQTARTMNAPEAALAKSQPAPRPQTPDALAVF